ncbi:MAG: NAD(P)-dependent oxidoreductase [Gammaproteobacteria bacterium]|nr:NAD(P)-dependent oxidoreductase [Gammaproteobacteria bacterium]MCZ6762285.1 NAD(P)-dependent oxidoreductase [Gammaproteobacteria bacterium]MCZ6879804.1 NAD(P)-dependent oxidoreductase [Gammaproteobacteria bacterium]
MKIPEILVIESVQKAGSLASILQVIADDGLVVEHLQSLRREQGKTVWEITLEMDEETDRSLFQKIDALPNARFLGKSDRVFDRHLGGKIETRSRVRISSLQILRDIYTPGVARVCLAIQDNPEKAWLYTNIHKTVAVVTNGTAILGLGDIGPVAGMPVMEGKAALFAELAGLSAVPILLDSKDPQQIVDTIEAMAPSFGAIQLEDIRAPECFEIERQLRQRLDIPVLHDDQHGTAVVALAALINATKRVGKNLPGAVIGQIGLGAAGIGIVSLLKAQGRCEVLGTDLKADARQRLEKLGGKAVAIEELMARADFVIATSGVKNLIKPEWVRDGQVILALSNPDPEIEPTLALEQGAAFAADGKGVNNVLGFPGLFKGALAARAKTFTREMLLAAAHTLADLAGPDDLVPDALDIDVHDKVAAAVAEVVIGSR